MRLALLIACWLALTSLASAAGPRVHIVLGENAPALERLAAEQLAGQLQRLYQADVQTALTAPADGPHVILVASPKSSTQVRESASGWPKLSDQGQVVRTVKYRGRPALLVGGGSPVATYWAACEFGHRLGIRTMLYGDVDPVSPPEFTLEGYDLIFEPTLRTRAWQAIDALPSGSESWGLTEHQRVLKQLAKLKFNHVVLALHPWQPFVHFEFQGVKKQTGVLWHGWQYPVSGETAGRSVFAGAKTFENPDFAGCETYEQRIAAGQKLIRGIIDAAHELGMTIGLKVDPLAFPEEFAALAKDPQLLGGLTQAQLRAYREAYPKLDAFYLAVSGSSEPDEEVTAAWKQLSAILGKESAFPQLPKVTDDVKDREWLAAVPMTTGSGNLLLTLGNARGSVLPYAFQASLPPVLGTLRKQPWDGFCISLHSVGDLDLPIHILSHGSFNPTQVPKEALEDLVTPICGEGVSDRVLKAQGLIEQATQLAEQHDPQFSRPVPGVILKHYTSDEQPPAWWGQARECYLSAMNEMYRANTRAREGSRSYTLYLARRCEFGFEYLNCVEAVRKAGLAKRKSDKETQLAELQKALESMHGALNALAAVARSPSDRGVIAALNEYGYRPLMKELEAAEEAAPAR